MLSHHTSKGSSFLNNGKFDIHKALHQDALRGASGLTNGARWQCNLQPLPGYLSRELFSLERIPHEGAFLAGRICKNNYGPPQGPFYLEQKSGVLVHRDTAKHFVNEDIKERIIEIIRTNEGQLTLRKFLDSYAPEWKDMYAVKRTDLTRAIQTMIASSELFLVQNTNSQNKLVETLTTFGGSEQPDETECDSEGAETCGGGVETCGGVEK